MVSVLFFFSLTCVWTCAWPNYIVAKYPSLPHQTPHQFCATVSHHLFLDAFDLCACQHMAPFAIIIYAFVL